MIYEDIFLFIHRKEFKHKKNMANPNQNAVTEQNGHKHIAARRRIGPGSVVLRLARKSMAGTITDQMAAASPAQPMAGKKPSGQIRPQIIGGAKVISIVLVRPSLLSSKLHKSAI